MNQIQGGGLPGLGGQGEEHLDEDAKMENVRMTYDVFVQNDLKATGHSLEWLPVTVKDSDNHKFEFNYFLLGTHYDDEAKPNFL